MAVDTAVFLYDFITGYKKKIVRSIDGSLAAGCGESFELEKFRTWFSSPQKNILEFPLSQKGDNFIALILDSNGIVYHMNREGSTTSLEGEFFSIGAAQELAFGAMAAGASAEEAVGYCIKYHSKAGGDVYSLKIDASIV